MRLQRRLSMSDRRMSYTSVAKILEDRGSGRNAGAYEELVPMFQRMLELSKILESPKKTERFH